MQGSQEYAEPSMDKIKGLEPLTAAFREMHATAHDAKRGAAKATRAEWAASETPGEYSEARRNVIATAESTAVWHERRARGQRERFERVAACGSKKGLSSCSGCGGMHEFTVGCGVNRLCETCGTKSAMKRRARFSLARAGRVQEASRDGLFRRRRNGIMVPRYVERHPFGLGRFTEKMLTFTVPHFGEAIEAVGERINAIFDAWRVFSRRLQAYLRRRKKWDPLGARSLWLHRAFEWTPGSDGRGHPHFHVWMLAPFVNVPRIREMWTDALEESGVELEGATAVVNVATFETLSPAAAREIIKGGAKQAIRYSGKSTQDTGPDAFAYADGWSVNDTGNAGDDVRAEVYKALEKRRISQGSAGFYRVIVETPPGHCRDCGEHGTVRVTFELTADDLPVGTADRWHKQLELRPPQAQPRAKECRA